MVMAVERNPQVTDISNFLDGEVDDDEENNFIISLEDNGEDEYTVLDSEEECGPHITSQEQPEGARVRECSTATSHNAELTAQGDLMVTTQSNSQPSILLQESVSLSDALKHFVGSPDEEILTFPTSCISSTNAMDLSHGGCIASNHPSIKSSNVSQSVLDSHSNFQLESYDKHPVENRNPQSKAQARAYRPLNTVTSTQEDLLAIRSGATSFHSNVLCGSSIQNLHASPVITTALSTVSHVDKNDSTFTSFQGTVAPPHFSSVSYENLKSHSNVPYLSGPFPNDVIPPVNNPIHSTGLGQTNSESTQPNFLHPLPEIGQNPQSLPKLTLSRDLLVIPSQSYSSWYKKPQASVSSVPLQSAPPKLLHKSVKPTKKGSPNKHVFSMLDTVSSSSTPSHGARHILPKTVRPPNLTGSNRQPTQEPPMESQNVGYPLLLTGKTNMAGIGSLVLKPIMPTSSSISLKPMQNFTVTHAETSQASSDPQVISSPSNIPTKVFLQPKDSSEKNSSTTVLVKSSPRSAAPNTRPVVITAPLRGANSTQGNGISLIKDAVAQHETMRIANLAVKGLTGQSLSSSNRTLPGPFHILQIGNDKVLVCQKTGNSLKLSPTGNSCKSALPFFNQASQSKNVVIKPASNSVKKKADQEMQNPPTSETNSTSAVTTNDESMASSSAQVKRKKPAVTKSKSLSKKTSPGKKNPKGIQVSSPEKSKASTTSTLLKLINTHFDDKQLTDNEAILLELIKGACKDPEVLDKVAQKVTAAVTSKPVTSKNEMDVGKSSPFIQPVNMNVGGTDNNASSSTATASKLSSQKVLNQSPNLANLLSSPLLCSAFDSAVFSKKHSSASEHFAPSHVVDEYRTSDSVKVPNMTAVSLSTPSNKQWHQPSLPQEGPSTSFVEDWVNKTKTFMSAKGYEDVFNQDIKSGHLVGNVYPNSESIDFKSEAADTSAIQFRSENTPTPVKQSQDALISQDASARPIKSKPKPSASVISSSKGIKIKICLNEKNAAKARRKQVLSCRKDTESPIFTTSVKPEVVKGTNLSEVEPVAPDCPVSEILPSQSCSNNGDEVRGPSKMQSKPETAEEMFQRFQEQAQREVYKAQLGVGYLSRSLRPSRTTVAFLDKLPYQDMGASKQKKQNSELNLGTSTAKLPTNSDGEIASLVPLSGEKMKNESKVVEKKNGLVKKKRPSLGDSGHQVKQKQPKLSIADHPKLKEDSSLPVTKAVYCADILAGHKVFVKFNTFENKDTGRCFLVPFFNLGGKRRQFDVEDMEYLNKAVKDVEMEERSCSRHLIYFCREGKKASFLRKESSISASQIDQKNYGKKSFILEGFRVEATKTAEKTVQWEVDKEISIEIDRAEVDDDYELNSHEQPVTTEDPEPATLNKSTFKHLMGPYGDTTHKVGAPSSKLPSLQKGAPDIHLRSNSHSVLNEEELVDSQNEQGTETSGILSNMGHGVSYPSHVKDFSLPQRNAQNVEALRVVSNEFPIHIKTEEPDELEFSAECTNLLPAATVSGSENYFSSGQPDYCFEQISPLIKIKEEPKDDFFSADQSQGINGNLASIIEMDCAEDDESDSRDQALVNQSEGGSFFTGESSRKDVIHGNVDLSEPSQVEKSIQFDDKCNASERASTIPCVSVPEISNDSAKSIIHCKEVYSYDAQDVHVNLGDLQQSQPHSDADVHPVRKNLETVAAAEKKCKPDMQVQEVYTQLSEKNQPASKETQLLSPPLKRSMENCKSEANVQQSNSGTETCSETVPPLSPASPPLSSTVSESSTASESSDIEESEDDMTESEAYLSHTSTPSLGLLTCPANSSGSGQQKITSLVESLRQRLTQQTPALPQWLSSSRLPVVHSKVKKRKTKENKKLKSVAASGKVEKDDTGMQTIKSSIESSTRTTSGVTSTSLQNSNEADTKPCNTPASALLENNLDVAEVSDHAGITVGIIKAPTSVTVSDLAKHVTSPVSLTSNGFLKDSICKPISLLDKTNLEKCEPKEGSKFQQDMAANSLKTGKATSSEAMYDEELVCLGAEPTLQPKTSNRIPLNVKAPLTPGTSSTITCVTAISPKELPNHEKFAETTCTTEVHCSSRSTPSDIDLDIGSTDMPETSLKFRPIVPECIEIVSSESDNDEADDVISMSSGPSSSRMSPVTAVVNFLHERNESLRRKENEFSSKPEPCTPEKSHAEQSRGSVASYLYQKYSEDLPPAPGVWHKIKGPRLRRAAPNTTTLPKPLMPQTEPTKQYVAQPISTQELFKKPSLSEIFGMPISKKEHPVTTSEVPKKVKPRQKQVARKRTSSRRISLKEEQLSPKIKQENIEPSLSVIESDEFCPGDSITSSASVSCTSLPQDSLTSSTCLLDIDKNITFTSSAKEFECKVEEKSVVRTSSTIESIGSSDATVRADSSNEDLVNSQKEVSSTSSKTKVVRRQESSSEVRLTWRQLSKLAKDSETESIKSGSSKDLSREADEDNKEKLIPCRMCLTRLEDIDHGMIPVDQFTYRIKKLCVKKEKEELEDARPGLGEDGRSKVNKGKKLKRKKKTVITNKAKKGSVKQKKDVVDSLASMLESLRKKAQQLEEEEKKKKQAEAHQLEEEKKKKQAEAHQVEEEEKKRHAEAHQLEEEEKKRQAEAPQVEEEEKKKQAEAHQVEEEEKKRQAEAYQLEEEEKKRQAEAHQLEEEEKKRQAEAPQVEEEEKKRQAEAHQVEEEEKKRQAEAHQVEEEEKKRQEEAEKVGDLHEQKEEIKGSDKFLEPDYVDKTVKDSTNMQMRANNASLHYGERLETEKQSCNNGVNNTTPNEDLETAQSTTDGGFVLNKVSTREQFPDKDVENMENSELMSSNEVNKNDVSNRSNNSELKECVRAKMWSGTENELRKTDSTIRAKITRQNVSNGGKSLLTSSNEVIGMDDSDNSKNSELKVSVRAKRMSRDENKLKKMHSMERAKRGKHNELNCGQISGSPDAGVLTQPLSDEDIFMVDKMSEVGGLDDKDETSWLLEDEEEESVDAKGKTTGEDLKSNIYEASDDEAGADPVQGDDVCDSDVDDFPMDWDEPGELFIHIPQDEEVEKDNCGRGFDNQSNNCAIPVKEDVVFDLDKHDNRGVVDGDKEENRVAIGMDKPDNREAIVVDKHYDSDAISVKKHENRATIDVAKHCDRDAIDVDKNEEMDNEKTVSKSIVNEQLDIKLKVQAQDAAKASQEKEHSNTLNTFHNNQSSPFAFPKADIVLGSVLDEDLVRCLEDKNKDSIAMFEPHDDLEGDDMGVMSQDEVERLLGLCDDDSEPITLPGFGPLDSHSKPAVDYPSPKTPAFHTQSEPDNQNSSTPSHPSLSRSNHTGLQPVVEEANKWRELPAQETDSPSSRLRSLPSRTTVLSPDAKSKNKSEKVTLSSDSSSLPKLKLKFDSKALAAIEKAKLAFLKAKKPPQTMKHKNKTKGSRKYEESQFQQDMEFYMRSDHIKNRNAGSETRERQDATSHISLHAATTNITDDVANLNDEDRNTRCSANNTNKLGEYKNSVDKVLTSTIANPRAQTAVNMQPEVIEQQFTALQYPTNRQSRRSATQAVSSLSDTGSKARSSRKRKTEKQQTLGEENISGGKLKRVESIFDDTDIFKEVKEDEQKTPTENYSKPSIAVSELLKKTKTIDLSKLKMKLNPIFAKKDTGQSSQVSDSSSEHKVSKTADSTSALESSIQIMSPKVANTVETPTMDALSGLIDTSSHEFSGTIPFSQSKSKTSMHLVSDSQNSSNQTKTVADTDPLSCDVEESLQTALSPKVEEPCQKTKLPMFPNLNTVKLSSLLKNIQKKPGSNKVLKADTKVGISTHTVTTSQSVNSSDHSAKGGKQKLSKFASTASGAGGEQDKMRQTRQTRSNFQPCEKPIIDINEQSKDDDKAESERSFFDCLSSMQSEIWEEASGS